MVSEEKAPESSFIMTVYNREPEVLLSTLRGLFRSIDDDSEVIVVNDGSEYGYQWARAYAEPRFPRFKWLDIEPYEACRINGNFNNPAKAFNAALSLATGKRLYVMSSDVIVTPNAIKQSLKFDFSEMAWTPLVLDLESSVHYCGPSRVFPAPWCLGLDRQIAIDAGGWDENYLKGMCYEDNDFIGRTLLKTGRFIGDWSVQVYHQSHLQPAYEVHEEHVMLANRINKTYTKRKWAGIPFSGSEDPCFDVLRKPYVTGDIVHECRYYGTLLEDTIRMTKSPFNPNYEPMPEPEPVEETA